MVIVIAIASYVVVISLLAAHAGEECVKLIYLRAPAKEVLHERAVARHLESSFRFAKLGSFRMCLE